MIDDQIYIPLRKKLKAGTFWQNHTEHGMCLLRTAFLTTPHRITVFKYAKAYLNSFDMVVGSLHRKRAISLKEVPLFSSFWI